MKLSLDETQQLLRDNLRGFLEREASFASVRTCEREGRADAALWQSLLAQGWLAAPLPAAQGGSDGGLLVAGLLVEEIERRAALVPSAEWLACALALARAGEGEGAARALAETVGGRCLPVPAVLEQSDRFDDCRAEVSSDGRLRGEKYFVDYAELATHHLVVATRGGERGLYLVSARDAGLKCERVAAIGRIPRAIVHYDGVPAERVAGAAGAALLVQVARALCSAQILACMQKSLEATVAYTSVREQFGRPIGSFQAVQHHAANMAIAVESARFLVYQALDALERGDDAEQRVAAAKAAVSQAAPEVVMLGHQLHGGQGFIEENDLYFFTVRAKDRSLMWGSLEECLDEIAAAVEREEDWL
jgi:alkylation response protein AidB-like acyl-CoA dehydrogenase